MPWHTARHGCFSRDAADLNALTPDELKALIVSQHEQIVSRDSEIEQLKLLIAKLRRMQFGRSSEKLDRQIEQLELRLEALQENDAEDACGEAPSNGQRRIGTIGTAAIASAASKRSTNAPAEAGSLSGLRTENCASLGEDVSEMLERIPSRFMVIRHVRVEAGLYVLRAHRASGGTEPPDRARHCWSGASRPCAGFEVLVIIFRCIVNRKSTPEKEWNWIVRHWRTGWVARADYLNRWWKRCDVT